MFLKRIFGSQELNELAASNPSVKVFKLDVTDFDALPSLSKAVDKVIGDNGLDILINSAGVLLNVSLLEGSPQDMIENYKINAVGPFIITRYFVPLLRKATTRNTASRPIVVNITSKMGSLDDNTSGGHYAYRASKTALNMVTKSLSVDLEKIGIRALAIHPGWVRTALGGPNGLIDPAESITNIIRVINDVRTGANKGLFLNYTGSEIKW